MRPLLRWICWLALYCLISIFVGPLAGLGVMVCIWVLIICGGALFVSRNS